MSLRIENCSNIVSLPANISVPYKLPDLSYDVSTMESIGTGSLCCSSLWDCISSFFSWIFCCFSGLSLEAQETRLQEIAAKSGYIWFYDAKQNYLTSFLGNFHPCKVAFRGIEFSCAEAAFQAAKFHPDRNLMASFARLNGDQAFKRATELTAAWTPAQLTNWQNRNFSVMIEVLDAKFSQNPDLKRLLLATGKAHLIEHVPVIGRDGYWADNGDGTGLNKLGEALMITRSKHGGQGVVTRPSNYNPKNCR